MYAKYFSTPIFDKLKALVQKIQKLIGHKKYDYQLR